MAKFHVGWAYTVVEAENLADAKRKAYNIVPDVVCITELKLSLVHCTGCGALHDLPFAPSGCPECQTR